MLTVSLYITLFACLASPALSAFTFTHSSPSSCADLSLTWTGGTPPFHVHLIPVFGTPRNASVPDTAFSNGKGSFSTQLPFDANTKFIIGMSDSEAFGSGGISEVLTTGNAQGGSSCDTKDPGVSFSFQLNSQLQQCKPYAFSAFDGAVGAVSIMALIPGGQPTVLNPPVGSKQFDWTCNVKEGTSMLFMMVDSQFRAGGSSNLYTVASGDDTCLSSNSPSSTPASVVPTSTNKGTNTSKPQHSSSSSPSSSSSSDGSDKKSSSPVGAIVGTILGSLVFIAAAATLALFYWRKKKQQQSMNGSSNINKRLEDQPYPFSNVYQASSSAPRPAEFSFSRVEDTNPYSSPPVVQDGLATQTHSTHRIHSYNPPFEVLSTRTTEGDVSSQGQKTTSPASEAPLHSPPFQVLTTQPAQQNGSPLKLPPSVQGNAQTNTTSLVSAPSSSAGRTSKQNASKSQQKALEAHSTSSRSTRYILHTDAEDSEELPVELPPKYSDRRLTQTSTRDHSSLAYASDAYDGVE